MKDLLGFLIGFFLFGAISYGFYIAILYAFRLLNQ